MQSISRTPSVYQIRHIASGKVYVGSATNPRTRRNGHFRDLRNGIHHSRYLQRAYDKYGEDAFVFEIIEPVLFCEDLTTRETYWIKMLRAAERSHGYNVEPIAGSSLGAKRTDAVRAGISERAKARYADPVYKAKAVAKLKAMYDDPKVRANISAARKAQFADPAQRKGVSDRAKARHSDPNYIANLSEKAKTRYTRPGERERLSAQSKAQYADPSKRAKLLEGRDAYFADPANRAKHSEQKKAQYADPEFRARMKALRDARKQKKTD